MFNEWGQRVVNVIVFEKGELEGGCLAVGVGRAEHLVRVMGVKVGSRVRVGEIGGKVGFGVVREVGEKGVVVGDIVLEEEIEAPFIDLVLALPRPQMLKRILENAPGFSVRSVYLIGSQRVEKSYFQTPVLRPVAIREHLMLGLQQAVTTHLPRVEVIDKFHVFINDYLERLIDQTAQHFLAHVPTKAVAAPTLTKLVAMGGIQKNNGVLLAIGPEGGWLDSEVDVFQKHGCKVFGLGERVLRVETAVYAALAQIKLLAE